MANLDALVMVDENALLSADLHDICVVAVNKMIDEGIHKHISYISNEDNIIFGLKEGGKIPKVTIEWVDGSETLPAKVP